MTAAKPEEANHNERTMDAVLFSRSLKPQLIFMSSFANDDTRGISYGNENCSNRNNKYTKKEMKNTLTLKLTNMVLIAPYNNHTAKKLSSYLIA